MRRSETSGPLWDASITGLSGSLDIVGQIVDNPQTSPVAAIESNR